MLFRFSRIKNQGLTLLELLAAIVIAAILFGIGIPSFFNLIANNRLTVATNELVTSMHYARSEAVSRETPVTACASEDGQSCSGSSDWGSGWIVFTDTNGTNGMLDAGDELLYSNLTDSDSIKIAAEYKYVRYSPRARAIR